MKISFSKTALTLLVSAILLSGCNPIHDSNSDDQTGPKYIGSYNFHTDSSVTFASTSSSKIFTVVIIDKDNKDISTEIKVSEMELHKGSNIIRINDISAYDSSHSIPLYKGFLAYGNTNIFFPAGSVYELRVRVVDGFGNSAWISAGMFAFPASG